MSLGHKIIGSTLKKNNVVLEPYYLLPCFIHRSTLILPLHLYFVPTIPSHLVPPIHLSPSSVPNTFIFISANLLFNFSVSVLSVHRPNLHPPLPTHPPVSLRARNPTHLLSPSLSRGLINLLKSQSAFYSITITPYPV